MFEGPRRPITRDDVDFVISLHYETPKAYDCFSWGALWNPVDFYVEWGVTPYLDNQFTHDGYFLCGSPAVERLAVTELGDRYATTPVVNVNHTLSGPVFAPTHKTDRRVAYCGINWERLSGKKGRFDDLLRALDSRDVLDIYGPSKVRDVAVWDGFKGYKRSVPFDGVTLMGELATSGAVLAFSSPAHIRSGVMSNRLFEAAAAGALIFTDGNPFVERYFAEEAIRLDLSGSAEDQAAEIERTLAYYNAHPDLALARCQALQEKFLLQYSLHRQLMNVYRRFEDWRVRDAEASSRDLGSLEFIILYTDLGMPFPADLIADITKQDYKNVRVTLVMPGDPAGNERLRALLPPGDIKIVRTPATTLDAKPPLGMILADALDDSTADYCSLLLGHERIFSSYAHEMLAAAKTEKLGASCGTLLRHYDPAERAFTGTEYVNYVPARSRRTGNSVTIGYLTILRSELQRLSGGFQFLSWKSLETLIEQSVRGDVAIVERPLLSGDLKQVERLRQGAAENYPPEKTAAILTRYMDTVDEDVKSVIEVFKQMEAVSATAIANLTENDRRLIIIDLLKALPIPSWIKNTVGSILRRLNGLPRRR